MIQRTVWLLLCSLLPAAAQTNYQHLTDLGSSLTGSNLFAAPIEGSDGRLYGTAAAGGTNNGGTVYALNKNGGGLAVLHHFPNGAMVSGSLAEFAGALYGTTQNAGSNGMGMVFKLNRDGSGFAVLHDFATNNTDGLHPFSGLIKAADGSLYGTTFDGGTNAYGTIFKINTNGSGYSVLCHFGGIEKGDGSNPSGLLLQGSDSLLYGTTQLGGSNDMGTVFRISTNGTGYSMLYQFSFSAGTAPFGGLIEGRDGFLYGTASSGGGGGGGVVFRLGKDGGSFSTVHLFSGSGGGLYPFAGLVQDPAGFLCGTTWAGGTNNFGTAFKVGTNGSGYATLHDFTDASADGSHPFGGLLLASDGGLYGSTYSGGQADGGSLFRLMPRVVFTGIEPGPGGMLLRMAGGGAGRAYHIQATTNLGNAGAWLTIGTNTAGLDGSFQYLDAGAASLPARCYRTFEP